jgi:hypothetical protein
VRFHAPKRSSIRFAPVVVLFLPTIPVATDATSPADRSLGTPIDAAPPPITMSHATPAANIADVDPAVLAAPLAVAQPSPVDLASSADAFLDEASARRLYCLAMIHFLSPASPGKRPELSTP